MKVASLFFVFCLFLFAGCKSIVNKEKDFLKSHCSELFTTCIVVDSIPNCIEVKAQNNPDFVSNSLYSEFKGDFEGPLLLDEVIAVAEDNFLNKKVKSDTKADSYWWYITGNEKNGSQGIIGIKDCTVVDGMLYSVWILDDIASKK
jgi:hypothetical protein